MNQTLALAILLVALTLSVPRASEAAPLCAGESSVIALGATGCELGGVTFSNFSVTGGSAFGTASSAGFDPSQILIEIAPGRLTLDIITSVPAIELRARPTNAANWTVPGGGGIGGSLGLTLNYSVAASGALLERYQLRAVGNGAFRAGGWSVVQDATQGSGPHSEGPSRFAMPIGTFDPGTSFSNITDTLGVSGSLFFAGTVSSFTNAYTLLSVPEPTAPVLLTLAMFATAVRRRGSTR